MTPERQTRLLRLARLRGDRLTIAILEGRERPTKSFPPASLADYVLFIPQRRAA